jgi:FkbM family methyltransferase
MIPLSVFLLALPFDPHRTNGGFSHALDLAKGLPGAIIDVGANGGAEAHLGSLAGRAVFSFECLASAYNELIGNVAFRSLPNVTLVHACAGAAPRITTLHHAQDSSSLNAENTAHDRELKKSRREHVHTESVLVQPLDPFFLGAAATASALAVHGNIALIKVDTQGTEASVLAGLRGVIERDRPVIMYEDMRKHAVFNYRWFVNDGDPKAMLEPLGYHCTQKAVEFFCVPASRSRRA